MFRSIDMKRAALAILVIAAGSVAVWLWSIQKAYAVGATQSDKLLICSAPIDERGAEAVFLLDTLTGELKAFQMFPQTGQYNASFFRNISADFGLDKIKGAPQFTMVATNQRFQRRGPIQPMPAAVHIAEASTGKMIAYTLNWNPGLASRRLPVNKPQPIVALDGIVFRGDVVRNPVTE